MQKSFSDLEYANKKKLTRRDRFLAEIDKATPWSKLRQAIEPFYSKGLRTGPPANRLGAHAANVRGPAVLWLVG